MGGSKQAWEEYMLRTEQEEAMDRILFLITKVEEHEATIRNKDHIIAGLKRKMKRIKEKENGGKVKNNKKIQKKDFGIK